jgi:hypothetical protein
MPNMEALRAYQRDKAEKIANGTWVEPKRLSPKEKAAANPKSLKFAILAKCAECMYDYADGRFSCEMPDCSLFPWMPYRNRIAPISENE